MLVSGEPLITPDGVKTSGSRTCSSNGTSWPTERTSQQCRKGTQQLEGGPWVPMPLLLALASLNCCSLVPKRALSGPDIA
eukprot:1165525-Rhodomonas_salina.1